MVWLVLVVLARVAHAAVSSRSRPGTPRPGEERKVARFYTVVSRDTVDADFAQNRQRFLAEQGYAYRIVDAGDLGATA